MSGKPKRFFTVVSSSFETFADGDGGRYSGASPSAAARKAALKLYKDKSKFQIVVKAITKKSEAGYSKLFKYNVKIETLAEPIELAFKTITHKVHLEACKSDPLKYKSASS